MKTGKVEAMEAKGTINSIDINHNSQFPNRYRHRFFCIRSMNHGRIRRFFAMQIFAFAIFAPQMAMPRQADHPPPWNVYLPVSFPDQLSEAFYGKDARMAASVAAIYRQMSLEERAAQMIMVAVASPKEYSGAQELLQKKTAGGVLLLNGTRAGFRDQVAFLNKLTEGHAVRPLFSCDCEPSLLYRKWKGAPVLPAAMLQDDDAVVKNTSIIAGEMRDVGTSLNFAPVVDRAANKAIISQRAFSDNPSVIARRASLFISTLQASGIAATIKHFPGHGNVKGDSHKGTVVISGELKELQTFRETIANAYPLVVMVGHITVQNNKQYGTEGLPSSISPKIIKKLLREEIGFEGIIATDAMNMKAVKKYKHADWRAALAGADLIVMPNDPEQLHQQIVAGLRGNDDLSRQLEQSIKRIIKLKLVTAAGPA